MVPKLNPVTADVAWAEMYYVISVAEPSELDRATDLAEASLVTQAAPALLL